MYLNANLGFSYRDTFASKEIALDKYLNTDYKGVDIIREITSISVSNENSETNLKLLRAAADVIYIGGETNDYVMVKINDFPNNGVQFNAVNIHAIMAYPPKKVDELPWFKKIFGSSEEKEQNKKDLENYAKALKEYELKTGVNKRSADAKKAASQFAAEMNSELRNQHNVVTRNLDEIAPSTSNNLARTQPQPTNTNEMTRRTDMGSPS